MSMHSLADEAMASARAKPIAVRLKAEPGWRAVVLEKAGDADGEGLMQVRVCVEKIRYWALDTSLPTDPGKPEHAAALGGLGGLFGGLFGLLPGFAATPATLWPLGKKGERLVGVHRVVPPGDETDDELATAAGAWLAASVEAYRKREADIARAREKASVR